MIFLLTFFPNFIFKSLTEPVSQEEEVVTVYLYFTPCKGRCQYSWTGNSEAPISLPLSIPLSLSLFHLLRWKWEVGWHMANRHCTWELKLDWTCVSDVYLRDVNCRQPLYISRISIAIGFVTKNWHMGHALEVGVLMWKRRFQTFYPCHPILALARARTE